LPLENELGLQLFARIGRNVRLTPEGEDLLVRSRRLLADAVALGERASALERGDVGVLRLGATPQVMESLLDGGEMVPTSNISNARSWPPNRRNPANVGFTPPPIW
jgi:hypothetical protein